MSWALDHLVVGAASLAQAVDWCERTLGVTPGPGGAHPRYGTHNRLLSLASPAFPRAYLELIAIDPDAPPPPRARWYDLDDAALQARLAEGPRLIHWVARCDGALDDELAALRALGLDRGEALPAERETPAGWLRWRITVRADGRRLLDGALPTLIAWGETHPVDGMAAAGLALESLVLGGLPAALHDRLPPGVRGGGERPLVATLHTPRGRVVLEG